MYKEETDSMENIKGSVSFYTLGCKVNQYETQMMKEQFRSAGYTIEADECPADIYIINTCSVTNLSDRKSRQYIRRLRKQNPSALIAVTGCYAQTSPEEVAALEGVCIVAGTNEKENLLQYVEAYQKKNGTQRETVDTFIHPYEELTGYEDCGLITSMDSRTRAYIKVQEGCNRFCSYCIIPYARGAVRSRSLPSILQEAEQLIANGFKEIVLTGINTALYGEDLQDSMQNGKGIEELIGAVNALPGDFRIRLSSLEPNVVNAETVRKLASYEKLCHHMHLSVQSGSDSVLKRMNRHYDMKQYLQIVEEMKKTDPNYAITTDIIVGFPAETDEEFQCSVDTVEKVGFAGVHVFRYSKRKGTPAAAAGGQIHGIVKNQRSHQLMEAASEAAENFRRNNLGRIGRVLFERRNPNNGMLEGYTDNYIRIYCDVNSNDKEYLEHFYNVHLDALFEDGMRGTIVTDG